MATCVEAFEQGQYVEVEEIHVKKKYLVRLNDDYPDDHQYRPADACPRPPRTSRDRRNCFDRPAGVYGIGRLSRLIRISWCVSEHELFASADASSSSVAYSITFGARYLESAIRGIDLRRNRTQEPVRRESSRRFFAGRIAASDPAGCSSGSCQYFSPQITSRLTKSVPFAHAKSRATRS